MLIFDVLKEYAADDMLRSALQEDTRDTSYGEFIKQVHQLCHFLQKKYQVGPTSRVVFFLPNSHNFATYFFAVTYLGGIVIPLNPYSSDTSHEQDLKKLQITHVVTASALLDRLRLILRNVWLSETPILETEKIFCGNEPIEYLHTTGIPKPKHHQTAVLLRTQGVVYKPRFVPATHFQLETHVKALKGLYDLKKKDHFLSWLTWVHPFSLIHGFLLPLLSGATCGCDPQLPPQSWIGYLKSQHFTRLVGTPKHFYELLVGCRNEKYTLPEIKSVSVGLGTLSQPLRKTFGLLRIPALHSYGLSESIWTLAMENFHTSNMMGSLAMQTLSGFEYKIMEPGGKDITHLKRKDGLLAVKGPGVMKQYEPPHYGSRSKAEIEILQKQEIKTADFLRNDWLYTQDVVRMEETSNGIFLHFLGRKQDCVLIGDRYASPYVIDALVKGSPGVIDAAGYPFVRKDGTTGVGCAIVKQEDSLNMNALQIKFQKFLPPAFMPETIRFVDAIPKDAGGNPLRYRLSLGEG